MLGEVAVKCGYVMQFRIPIIHGAICRSKYEDTQQVTKNSVLLSFCDTNHSN
jgi:hypothetical protein